MFRLLSLFLALLCASCETGGAAWSVVGQVVGITDGDTIAAVVNVKQIKIRLHGIDAPERGQPFGAAAKAELSQLEHFK